MINITVFTEGLAFHWSLHVTTETANGSSFVILVLGLKKHQRGNGSVKTVKRCKFIFSNRNITLVNLNKEFDLNLQVGVIYGTLLLLFLQATFLYKTPKYVIIFWCNFGLEHQIPLEIFWYPNNPLWDLLPMCKLLT